MMPLAIFLSAALMLTSCGPKAEPTDILFFYFESCAGCDDYENAKALEERVLELPGKTWDSESYNLAVPGGAERLKEVLELKGLPDISRSLPILIVDGDYTNGYDSIEEKLDGLEL